MNLTALSYDDILLRPRMGVVDSRGDIDTSATIGKWTMRLPVFSSPMETVTGYKMAKLLANLGCIGVLHRFEESYETEHKINSLRSQAPEMPVAIAVGRDDERCCLSADILVLDVAHANALWAFKRVEKMKAEHPEKIIVAGSVATRGGALALIGAGADILRVGIGAGAACTTREVTGFGVPMVTSIEECADAASEYGVKVIADGGIKNSGDVVKALAVGADYVMIGRMLAGTSESPMGKRYFGQASIQSSAYNGGHIEGAYGEVEDQGSAFDVIRSIEEGLKSGISYGGARDILGLQVNAEYMVVSPLTMSESGVRI